MNATNGDLFSNHFRINKHRLQPISDVAKYTVHTHVANKHIQPNQSRISAPNNTPN